MGSQRKLLAIKLQSLVKFVENGHSQVPERNTGIGGWVKRQRRSQDK